MDRSSRCVQICDSICLGEAQACKSGWESHKGQSQTKGLYEGGVESDRRGISKGIVVRQKGCMEGN